MVVPMTSTNWPATKWLGTSSAPTSRAASLATRNSTSFFLGSTLALAKWPRICWLTFFTLALPEPSWTAVVLFVSSERTATTCRLSTLSTVTGTCSPASVKTRVMPTFWATRPQRMVLFLLFPYPPWARLRAELDLDVDAGGEVELHQRVHRLRSRVD